MSADSPYLLSRIFHCCRFSALLAVCALLAPLPAGAADQPQAKKFDNPVLIKFTGEITRLNEHYLYRKLDDAKARGADLVIVEIDSPGGLLQESLNLAHRLRDTNWAHTVAYIPRRAISGGAIMALGCDEIVMRPNAQIGDAGAIYLDEFFMFREAEAKIRSHLAGEVRTLAEATGRPPTLAEAWVDKTLVVYRVRDELTGDESFMSQTQIDDSPDPGNWEKIALVDETTGGKYLQLSGKRAVELELAEAIADDMSDLKKRYNLRRDPVVLEWGWVDTTVMVLNHWTMAVLLLVVGLVALYIEISAPGISFGGLVAGLCFVLFFWSRFLGGTTGLLEVILFLSGLAFLAMEIFVIPGWGVSGITGILLMIASLVLAGQDFVVPHSMRDVSSLSSGLLVVFGSIGLFIVAAMVLARNMNSLPMFNRLVLGPPRHHLEDDEEPGDKKGPSTSTGEGFVVTVGDWGVADSPLRPAGKVTIGDEYIDVVTDGTFVEKGRPVRVIRITGNRIVVREVEDSA